MAIHKSHKIGVLGDYPNLIKSSKQFHNALIDFNCLLEPFDDSMLFYAIIFMSNNSNGARVQHVLKKMGFDICLVGNSKNKNDIDGALIMKAVSIADKIDTLRLCSGDGDYCELVRYLQIAKGIRVTVRCIEQSASYELLELADEVQFINSFLKNNK